MEEEEAKEEAKPAEVSSRSTALYGSTRASVMGKYHINSTTTYNLKKLEITYKSILKIQKGLRILFI